MKKLEELTDDDKYDLIEPLIKYLKKTWDIKAEPKGYGEFTKNYIDFDGYDELDYDKIYDSFKGFKDGDRPFPLTVSLPSVAYDDICQGNKPLEVLVYAIWKYGYTYGKYEEKNNEHRKLVLKHVRDLLKDL